MKFPQLTYTVNKNNSENELDFKQAGDHPLEIWANQCIINTAIKYT